MTDEEIKELIEDLELVLESVQRIGFREGGGWSTEEFILFKWINHLRKQIGLPLIEPSEGLAHPILYEPPDPNTLVGQMIITMDKAATESFLNISGWMNGTPKRTDDLPEARRSGDQSDS